MPTIQPGVLAQARRAKHEKLLFPVLLSSFVFLLFLTMITLVLYLNQMTNEKKVAAAQAPLPTALPIHQAVPTLKETIAPDRMTRILIMGSDRRGDDPGFRTDVLILLTIDAANGQVSMLSFPRDLDVRIPGYGEQRINTVMGIGGFELLQDTFEQDFGVRPEYYFITNFDNFIGVINSIGGVEVHVSEPLSDSCDLVINRNGICEFEPGPHVMDGATALWYIRSRHTSSDFDRLRRAQEVLMGVLNRLTEMNALVRLPELYNQYHSDIETNISLPQMAGFLPVAAQVFKDHNRIHRYTITPNEASDWWTAEGAEVLLPDYDAIREIIKQASFSLN